MSRRKWMIFLDVFMFILIVLLYSPLFTSISLHELLGTIFILPFILHLLFSWLWIEQSTKRLIKTIRWRHKFNYFLNLTLFVLVISEIVSGLVISQIILPSIGIETINDWKWRALHNQSSVGIVIILSCHIAMNWRRIFSYFEKHECSARHVNRSFLLGSRVVLRELKRTLFIAFAAGIITTVAYLIVGTPDKERVSLVNDILRLKQNIISGAVQLIGTIIAIVILVYISHRFLKIRL